VGAQITTADNVLKKQVSHAIGLKRTYVVHVLKQPQKLCMDPKIREFIEAQTFKTTPKVMETDFMKEFKVGISFQDLLKDHNHEIWEKCECGNEEDLRKKWICSECGAVLFEPTSN